MSQENIKISDWPSVDPALDAHDIVSVYEAKDRFYMEQLVRNEEIKVLRHKLKWCYRREGVNHLQNCRHLSMQYLELMKEGWFKPFKTPLETALAAAAVSSGDSSASSAEGGHE